MMTLPPPPTRVMTTALALCVGLCGVQGQMFDNKNTKSSGCPLSSFRSESDRVGKSCCYGGKCKPGKAPSHCDLRCAEQYVPFYSKCKAPLDALFDGSDGHEDGKAIGFDHLFRECTGGKHITAMQTLDRVRQLRKDRCSVNLNFEQSQNGRRLQIGIPTTGEKVTYIYMRFVALAHMPTIGATLSSEQRTRSSAHVIYVD